MERLMRSLLALHNYSRETVLCFTMREEVELEFDRFSRRIMKCGSIVFFTVAVKLPAVQEGGHMYYILWLMTQRS